MIGWRAALIRRNLLLGILLVLGCLAQRIEGAGGRGSWWWKKFKDRREVDRALRLTESCDKYAASDKALCRRDFYALFQMKRSASAKELKAARKKLLLLLHPDKNRDPRAGQAFDMAQDAFEDILKQGSSTRREHDAWLSWRDKERRRRRLARRASFVRKVRRSLGVAKEVAVVGWQRKKQVAVGAVVSWLAIALATEKVL